MERLGRRENPVGLVKGVKGLISRERAVEEIDKGILRAENELFVFKDGTIRFDMIDLPLTHFRPDEVGVRPRQALQIGYPSDIHGAPLSRSDQVLESQPQDILISESCADYMVTGRPVHRRLLTRCYHLPPYYSITSREES